MFWSNNPKKEDENEERKNFNTSYVLVELVNLN